MMMQEKPLTRRGVLSTVASIYDPLGLIAPFTLRGKQILQNMCQQNMTWDDPLDGDLLHKWNGWTTELQHLEDVSINRCYKPLGFGTVKKYELHHFSDASYSGYGQCTYVRLINTQDEIHCALVMAKARVTPKKVLTIPRLELMAAVTSVKVSNILREELCYTNCQEFYWTDSQIVLSYIQNDAKRFHVFVANRVQLILNHTSKEQWRHIKTDENPADHTSRGLAARNISTSNWLTGPRFLWRVLPDKESVSDVIAIDDPEVKKIIVHQVTRSNFSMLRRLEQFSDWNRAVSGINSIRRAIQHKHQVPLKSNVDQLKDTETFIIKKCQMEQYPEEISALNNKDTVANQMLLSLDPFIDEDMILRVGGRLKRSILCIIIRNIH